MMASCPISDPRSRRFVAPPRAEQSQQPAKRPVYGDRKRLEARQAKKAARKAARQDASCSMTHTDPAPLLSSPALLETSGEQMLRCCVLHVQVVVPAEWSQPTGETVMAWRCAGWRLRLL